MKIKTLFISCALLFAIEIPSFAKEENDVVTEMDQYECCIENVLGTMSKYNFYEYIPPESIEPIFIGNYTLTAYCSCSKCCGKWGGHTTSSGTTPTEGRTVGCNSIPAGTKILIGENIYIVEDTGNMRDNVIDIYMNSHKEALNFGVKKNVPIYIIN